MDTDNIVLRKWQDLEKKWLVIHPEEKSIDIGEPLEMKHALWGGHKELKVYQLSNFESGAWEVSYNGIKVMYFGSRAEERAREFAKSLEEDDATIQGNVSVCLEFLRSCENWKDYNNDENRDKFVTALMKVRPLDVNKVWAVFRTMIDSGEIKPIHN